MKTNDNLPKAIPVTMTTTVYQAHKTPGRPTAPGSSPPPTQGPRGCLAGHPRRCWTYAGKSLLISIFALTVVAGCAKPHLPDVDIWTASATGNLEAVRQHARAGTPLDARDADWGGTPLMAAALNGHTEVVRLLVKNRAPLETKNKEGATALLTAAFFGHPETVRVLLESGADVNARNNRGETPLDTVAAEWSPQLRGIYELVGGMLQVHIDYERIRTARPEVFTLLRQYGGKPGSEL